MSEFNKIIGYEAIKDEAERICDLLKNFDKYSKLGVKTPGGVLFYGEPGVGKTLMANCMVKESGRNAYVIRKDRAESEFVDYIKSVFDEAVKNAPSIVLLDDLDKFANSEPYRFNYTEYVTVQSCMDDVRGREVFVIATANEIHSLPMSLRRKGRFDKIIEMEMPYGEEADEIIRYFLETKELDECVDIKHIVRLMSGKTCAELESIVNEAGIYAGYEGRQKIVEEDLINAYLRVAFDSPEAYGTDDAMEVKRMAVHEAGHVLLGEIFNSGIVNVVSISNHIGSTGGVTSYSVKKSNGMTYLDMQNKVMILLAGKAATEIVLGEIDMGTGDDIRRAVELLEEELTNTGYMDFRVYPTEMPTREMAEAVHKLVHEELMRLYMKAKSIISSNRILLDEYVKRLIEKKTITYKDIAEINRWYLRLV